MKEKKSVESNKIKLQLWMKLVLLIALFFIVIILYSLILANIINYTATQNRTLPQVPFSTTKSFCPLAENVHSVDYKEGGMLIVSKPKNYIVGDKILIQNRYADKKIYSINNYYVLGVITDVKEQEYIASLFSYDKESLVIQPSEIEGKVDKYISAIGGLYNNMIGIKGYILFGAIPIMGFCLLYFIFRLVCIDKKVAAMDNEDESKFEEIGLSNYLEEEIEVEWITPSKQQIKEEEEQEMKPMILKTEQSVPVEQQGILTTEEEEYQNTVETGALVQEEDDTDYVEEATVEELPIVDSTVEEPTLEESEPTIEPIYNRLLSADEIIAMYRENQKAQEKTPSMQFEKIARMYYDNDIENYD